MPDSSQHAAAASGNAPVSNRWRALALFLLTAAGVAASLGFVHVLLFPVVAAVAFAVVLQKPRIWLRRRLGPATASATLIAVLCLAVVVPGFFVVRSLAGEVMATVHYVQDGSANQDFHTLMTRHPKVGGKLQNAADELTPDQAGRHFAGQAAVWLGRGLQGVAAGVTEVVLMLFFLFFLLRDEERAVKTLGSLIPLPADETLRFLGRLGDLTYAVFAGRFVIAGIQGVLAGLAYLLLGVPGALLWGTVTAVCCLVPAFGAFIAWVPIALYLGLADSWTKALILRPGVALWSAM